VASLVVGVEDLVVVVVVVVEADHRLVVVLLRRGYDPGDRLVDLRGEADRLHLALVVVEGVGNFHIAFA